MEPFKTSTQVSVTFDIDGVLAHTQDAVLLGLKRYLNVRAAPSQIRCYDIAEALALEPGVDVPQHILSAAVSYLFSGHCLGFYETVQPNLELCEAFLKVYEYPYIAFNGSVGICTSRISSAWGPGGRKQVVEETAAWVHKHIGRGHVSHFAKKTQLISPEMGGHAFVLVDDSVQQALDFAHAARDANLEYLVIVPARPWNWQWSDKIPANIIRVDDEKVYGTIEEVALAPIIKRAQERKAQLTK